MDEEIRQCYRTLSIEPEASQEAIKQAWRDHVKAWHPDLHPNDSKFQRKATEKTKEINNAKDKIIAYLAGAYEEPRASAYAREAEEGARQARQEAEARARDDDAREREEARSQDEGRRRAEHYSKQERDSAKPAVLWSCEECGSAFAAPYDAFGLLAICPNCHQTTRIGKVFKPAVESRAAQIESVPGSPDTKAHANNVNFRAKMDHIINRSLVIVLVVVVVIVITLAGILAYSSIRQGE